MAPRETENNAYANFYSDQQRVLWYVMVFSRVVNSAMRKVFLDHFFWSLETNLRIVTKPFHLISNLVQRNTAAKRTAHERKI